jgi:hypothetical protein
MWFSAPGQSQYFVPIELLSATVGSNVRLPYVPNSMVMDQTGTNLYFGSSHELMIYGTSANAITKQDPTVPGVVLAVAPNNGELLINDPVRQVFYIYQATGTVAATFGGLGSAAQWTPDSKTLYISDSSALNNPANGITGHTDAVCIQHKYRLDYVSPRRVGPDQSSQQSWSAKTGVDDSRYRRIFKRQLNRGPHVVPNRNRQQLWHHKLLSRTSQRFGCYSHPGSSLYDRRRAHSRSSRSERSDHLLRYFGDGSHWRVSRGFGGTAAAVDSSLHTQSAADSQHRCDWGQSNCDFAVRGYAGNDNHSGDEPELSYL